MTTATLTFPTRIMAEEFCTLYGRFSHIWHTLGSGSDNVKVTVDVVEWWKDWISNYISNINK